MAVVQGTNNDDILNGTSDADTIFGEGGDDTIRTFAGRDTVFGGAGDDNINASDGTVATESFGDYIRPGLGSDTIIGNAALFASGEGIDLSYADITTSGGITITTNANGSGTVTSATGGLIDDTFTFTHYFEGTNQNDTFIGSATANAEQWSPLEGNDTITGGDGWDIVRYDFDATYGGTSGIVVNLRNGTATDGFGNTDTLSGIDEISATDSNDNVTGNRGDNTLRGFDGNDNLFGENGNDILIGGEGRDQLRGGNGDDFLDGSEDTSGTGDSMQPGLGADTIVGSSAIWASGGGISVSYGDLSGTGGLTITSGADGSGTVVSGTTGLVNDTFTFANGFAGSHDDDVMTGSNEDHYEGWIGNDGSDTINGGAGTDELNYSSEEDINSNAGGVIVNFQTGRAIDTYGETDTFSGIEIVRGTSLVDRFTGSSNQDSVIYRGFAGADRINGLTGSYDIADYTGDAGQGGTQGIRANLTLGTIRDGFGDTDRVSSIDFVRGTTSNDIVEGDGADNRIDGSSGDDTLSGLAGNDEIFGGNGKDKLSGGEGNDQLNGGAGRDTIDGDAGNDRIIGGDKEDVLSGGIGNDEITGGLGADEIFGGDGKDELDGGAGTDVLNGDGGADILRGGGKRDFLFGGGKDDLVFGDEGFDRLFGGGGNDTLDGGTENDRLTGGTGNDTFIFGRGYGEDRIRDFEDDVDTIQLNDNLWVGALTAQQIVDQFGSVAGTTATLAFNGGDALIFNGVFDVQSLVDDISIF